MTLHDGTTVTLFDVTELTVRSVHRIERATIKAEAVTDKLQSFGFVPSEPETLTASFFLRLTDEEQGYLDDAESVLIEEFVKSWSRGERPSAEDVQNLSIDVYRELVAASAGEWTKRQNFSQDLADDPKVDTANSPV